MLKLKQLKQRKQLEKRKGKRRGKTDGKDVKVGTLVLIVLKKEIGGAKKGAVRDADVHAVQDATVNHNI